MTAFIATFAGMILTAALQKWFPKLTSIIHGGAITLPGTAPVAKPAEVSPLQQILQGIIDGTHVLTRNPDAPAAPAPTPGDTHEVMVPVKFTMTPVVKPPA